MAQTTINIRMDEELKKQFDCLCSEARTEYVNSYDDFCKENG